MRNEQDEKMFDAAVYSKLASATEEVPEYLWKSISVKSKKRKGLLWFFGSLTGFFFHDMLLAALVVLLSAANPSFSDDVKVSAAEENKSNTDYSIKFQTMDADVINDTKKSSAENVVTVETSNTKELDDENISAKENNVPTPTDKKIVNDNRNKSGKINIAFRNESKIASEIYSTQEIASGQLLSHTIVSNTINENRNPELIDLIASRQLLLGKIEEADLFFPEVKKVKARSVLPVSIRMGAGAVYDISKIESQKNLSNRSKNWMNKTNAFLIADMRFANNWLLTAGIQQQGSQIDIEVTDVISFNFWNVDTVSGFIISPFNPPVPFTYYDSSLVNSSLAKKYSGTVDVKLISTSLQLERSLHRGAFDFRVGAGLGINIYSKSKGSLLLQNSEEAESISLDNTFSNSIEPLFISSFEAGYYIGGMFEPFVRIQYNSSFNNLMNGKSILEYKTQSVSGCVGLRVRITE